MGSLSSLSLVKFDHWTEQRTLSLERAAASAGDAQPALCFRKHMAQAAAWTDVAAAAGLRSLNIIKVVLKFWSCESGLIACISFMKHNCRHYCTFANGFSETPVSRWWKTWNILFVAAGFDPRSLMTAMQLFSSSSRKWKWKHLIFMLLWIIEDNNIEQTLIFSFLPPQLNSQKKTHLQIPDWLELMNCFNWGFRILKTHCA